MKIKPEIKEIIIAAAKKKWGQKEVKKWGQCKLKLFFGLPIFFCVTLKHPAEHYRWGQSNRFNEVMSI